MGILDTPASPTPLEPYSPATRPWYLDCAWNYFHGRGYTSGQSTTTTTTTAPTSIGDITLNVASGSSFVAKEPIVIRTGSSSPYTYQTFVVVSSTSTTITVYGKVKAVFPTGSLVYPAWENDSHPLSSPSYVTFAEWVANAKQRAAMTGTSLFASGGMSSTYTDANTVANVPVGWESVGSATFLATNWGAASASPAARQGTGAYFTGGSGTGMRTLTSIPVRPGDAITVTAHCKITAGSGTLTVVDKNATSTVLAGPALLGSTVLPHTWNSLGIPVQIECRVPVGVSDIEVRALSTSTGGEVYVDDVRVMFSRQEPNNDRYVFEDPGNAAIVVLGDSWSVAATGGDNFVSSLNARFGRTLKVINSGTSGQRLDQMLARFSTDVAAYKPRYVVHFSAFMNDLSAGHSQSTMETNVDTFIDECRKIGAVPVLLGVGPMESELVTAMARNDQMRARCDRIAT